MQSRTSRAEGERGPEETKAPQRLLRGRNILLIALVVVVTLVLVSAGALIVAAKLGFTPSLLGGLFGEQALAGKVKEPAFMYEVPEILVNLPEGGRRFLSVKFYLGFDESKLVDELDKRMPEIRDEINKILWSKDADGLATPEGKEELREEILAAVNAALNNGELRGLYFWHVLVQ